MDERRRQYEDIEHRPPVHPQGRQSDHMDPRQLPPGTPNMLNIDVMSSDGVSTITGPAETGLIDLYTPIQNPQQDAIGGGDQGFENHSAEMEDLGGATAEDGYDDEGMPLGEDYDYGHTINDTEYPTRRPPNMGGAAHALTAADDDDPLEEEEFAEEPDRLVVPESPPRNSFGRNEYNARVEDWYNVMQQTTVSKNASSNRIANPERPQGTSPHRTPVRKISTVRPPPGQFGGGHRPPMNSSATIAQQPMVPAPSRPPPLPQQAMLVESNDDRGLRICWIVLVTLCCVIVIIGAVGAGLFMFTDLLDFQSSSDAVEPTMAPSLTLTPPEVVQEFSGPPSYGATVDLSEHFLAVGAPAAAFGIVSSFADPSKNQAWSFVEDVAGSLGFGSDFALLELNNTDAILLVGSPSEGDDQSGGAFLYRYQQLNNQWQNQPNVSNVFIRSNEDEFGTSVALSQNFRAVVGAPGRANGQGQVYTFTISDDGNGALVTEVLDSVFSLVGSSPSSRFGETVDITADGNTIAVGEPGTGSLVIFDWNGSGWEQSFAFQETNLQDMGSSLLFLSPELIAVGCPSCEDNRGVVRFFQRNNALSWITVPQIVGGNSGDRLGSKHSISGSGSQIFLGSAQGKVQGFEFADSEWRMNFEITEGNAAISSVASFQEEGSKTVSLLVGVSSEGRATLYTGSLLDARDSDDSTQEPKGPTISPAPTMMPAFPSARPSAEPTSAHPSLSPSNSPSYSPTTRKEWYISAGPFQSSGVATLFGKAVTIVDDFLVIGEPGFGASGDVTIIQRSNIFGNVVYDFSSLSAIEFGFAVDSAVVSGRPSIVVGARNTRDDLDGSIPSTRFGTAHVFDFDSDINQWVQIGDDIWPQLIFIEAAAEFGSAVCMATTSTLRRIAVGAPSSSDFSTANGGRVYTYEYDGVSWNVIGGTLRGSRDEMLLGSSMDISIDGDYLLVGAPGDAGGDGAAFYYRWDGTSWVEIFEVKGVQGSSEGLGTSVAVVSNDIIAVGSSNYTSNVGTEGKIAVYQRASMDLPAFEHVTDFVGEAGDSVGRTLSSKNGLIAFGTRRSFHVFRLNGADKVEVPPLGGPIIDVEVVSISIADDGTTVAVGLETEDVFLYELSTVQ